VSCAASSSEETTSIDDSALIDSPDLKLEASDNPSEVFSGEVTTLALTGAPLDVVFPCHLYQNGVDVGPLGPGPIDNEITVGPLTGPNGATFKFRARCATTGGTVIASNRITTNIVPVVTAPDTGRVFDTSCLFQPALEGPNDPLVFPGMPGASH